MIDLYEGAIEALEGAERAFSAREAKAAEEFYTHLTTCQRVMHQLITSLDLKSGGETAAHLFRMYDFINYQLVRANIAKEISGLREARDLLVELRAQVQKEIA